MGLFLMGPTLPPHYQPGGGGAAPPARDAAGPADTAGRLWSKTQDTALGVTPQVSTDTKDQRRALKAWSDITEPVKIYSEGRGG